jgi:hypothetical protein
VDIQPQPQILEDTDDALHNAVAENTTDEKVEFSSFDDLKKEGTEPAAPAAPAAKAPAAPADDDLPPEYKGKTVKEIVKMHQDAHRLIGRQGTELGELRGRADQAFRMSMEALKASREQRAPAAPAQKAQEEEFDETAFFNKPSEAIAKAIANNPVIQEIRRTLGNQEAAQAAGRAQSNAERFNSQHPDAGEILRDPEFRKWVGGSRVRTALLQRADKQYDFEAGDEVFSTWKALRGVKQAQSAPAAGTAPAATSPAAVSAAAATLAKARQAKAEAVARAATVPTAGAGGAAKPSGASGKRHYRRADVVRLMVEDPERYEAMSDELQKAYAEGRVR